MTSQTINLNLIPGGITPVIHVSQYDKGQTWTFNLYAGSQPFSIPANSSVVILGTKKDKTGFEYACSYSGNVVTAIEQQQMTVFAGDVSTELRITNGNDLIGSMNFIIKVEAAALADDTQISETDLPLIEEAIEELERVPAIITQMETLAQQASTSATTATTKAGEASTSATNAAASATSAAGSASTATTKAGQASTSATNAANSATSASNSATSAAGSASTATTKAGEAATSATNAAASAQQAQQAAASLTVDSALSSTSTNPVQNKIVKGEFDSVKQALSDEVATRAANGAHNLLSLTLADIKAIRSSDTWDGNTCTLLNGTVMTISVDSSGYVDKITVTGSSWSFGIKGSFVLKAGRYKLYSQDNATVRTPELYLKYGNTYVYEHNGEFTVTEDVIASFMGINGNGSYTNHELVPMLLYAKDSNTEFTPYAMTNQQLTMKREATSISNIDVVHNGQMAILDIHGANLGTVGTGWTNIVTLDYKPKNPIYFLVSDASGNLFRLGINTNGLVQIKPIDGNQYSLTDFYVQVTYSLI